MCIPYNKICFIHQICILSISCIRDYYHLTVTFGTSRFSPPLPLVTHRDKSLILGAWRQLWTVPYQVTCDVSRFAYTGLVTLVRSCEQWTLFQIGIKPSNVYHIYLSFLSSQSLCVIWGSAWITPHHTPSHPICYLTTRCYTRALRIYEGYRLWGWDFLICIPMNF